MSEHYQREEYDGRVYFVMKGFTFADETHVWCEKGDPRSGKKYYVQKASGERCWQLPVWDSGRTEQTKNKKKDGHAETGESGVKKDGHEGGDGTSGSCEVGGTEKQRRRAKKEDKVAGRTEDYEVCSAFATPAVWNGDNRSRSKSSMHFLLEENVMEDKNDMRPTFTANCIARPEEGHVCSPESTSTLSSELFHCIAGGTAACIASDGARGGEGGAGLGRCVEVAPGPPAVSRAHDTPVTRLQIHDDDDDDERDMVRKKEEGNSDFFEELTGDPSVDKLQGAGLKDGTAAVTEWKPPALKNFDIALLKPSATQAMELTVGSGSLVASKREVIREPIVPLSTTPSLERHHMAVSFSPGFMECLDPLPESPSLVVASVINGEERREEGTSNALLKTHSLYEAQGKGERPTQLSPELLDLLSVSRLRCFPNRSSPFLTENAPFLSFPATTPPPLNDKCSALNLSREEKDGGRGERKGNRKKEYKPRVQSVAGRLLRNGNADCIEYSLQLLRERQRATVAAATAGVKKAEKVGAVVKKKSLGPKAMGPSSSSSSFPSRSGQCVSARSSAAARAKPALTPYTTSFSYALQKEARRKSLCSQADVGVGGCGRILEKGLGGTAMSSTREASTLSEAATTRNGVAFGEVEPTALSEATPPMPFLISSSTFVYTKEGGKTLAQKRGVDEPKGCAEGVVFSEVCMAEEMRSVGSTLSLPQTLRRWSENPVYEIPDHAPSRRNSTRAPSETSVHTPPPSQESFPQRGGLLSAAPPCRNSECPNRSEEGTMPVLTEAVGPVAEAVTVTAQRNTAPTSSSREGKRHRSHQRDTQVSTRMSSRDAPRTAVVNDLVRRYRETPAHREAVVTQYLRRDKGLLWQSLKEKLVSLQLCSTEFLRRMSEWDAQHPDLLSNLRNQLEIARTKRSLLIAEWEKVEDSCWEYFRMQLTQGVEDPLDSDVLQWLWQVS